jgi:hypothetical protein
MELPMSETNTVSPLRQRMLEDMAARKLNPHTAESEGLRTGFRRKPDSVPMIADSR